MTQRTPDQIERGIKHLKKAMVIFEDASEDTPEPANCPYCGSGEMATSHKIADEWHCRCRDCERVSKIGTIDE